MSIRLDWFHDNQGVYAEFKGVITDQEWYDFDNHLVWDYLNKVTGPLALVIDGYDLEHLPSIATMTKLRAGSHHRLQKVVLVGIPKKSQSLILKRIAALFRLECVDADWSESARKPSPAQPASVG